MKMGAHGFPGHHTCAPRTVSGVGLQWVQFPPGNWVAPAGSYRSGGGTYRATFGGALASRELWFGRSGSDRYLSLLWGLVTRVSGRIPFGASCPRWSLAREASTLSLVTCHAGFSRRGIDPVGETSNVPDTPLGSRRLVVSTPASANRRDPWSSQTKSPRSQPCPRRQPSPRRQPNPGSHVSVHFPSPSPPRRRGSMSSTRTRPESMFIPTCIWSASPPTATPTQSGSSAPTPPIFRRSSRG